MIEYGIFLKEGQYLFHNVTDEYHGSTEIAKFEAQ
jgi:hypothetical protein